MVAGDLRYGGCIQLRVSGNGDLAVLSYCPGMPSTEDYSAAGLYDPGSNAASDRLELLEWLDELGFTLDEMVDGLHR